MKDYKRLNLNESIRAKLLPEGLLIWQRHCESLSLAFPELRRLNEQKVDDTGYLTLQGWEFMQVFGPHVKLLGKPLFDMNILVQVKD